jgi:DNA-binding transcriptional ArsR family regulator
LNTVEEEDLNLTFAALADPTRRAILTRLAQGEATVKVLAEPFTMSLQAVSRHLKVLEGAGLITRGHQAQFRPRALRGAALEGATSWMTHTQEMWRQETTTGAHQGVLETTAPPMPAFTPQGDWAR